jgi:hypothetical protein
MAPASTTRLRRAVLREVALIAAVALVGCLVLTGCIASVQPIMPPDVATALAQQPMRRLETTNLNVYYPADRHDAAIRFAQHAEGYARELHARQLIQNAIAGRRMTLILPDLTFNNTFTSPIFLGYAPFAVVPTYQTIDAFTLEMGLPSDAGIIACHEMTHYVQFQQVAGFASAVDAVLGPGHAAGGTALTLAMAMWRIPFELTYQLAGRVEDDHALVQIVAFRAQWPIAEHAADC